MMSVAIKATYDGKVLIPERPLDLPVGEVVQLQIPTLRDQHPTRDEIERRLALHHAASGLFTGPTLPDEALTREAMYEDRI